MQTLLIKCSVCIILYKEVPHLFCLPKVYCVKPVSYLKCTLLGWEVGKNSVHVKCSDMALMSPGLRGLCRHGSCRRQAHVCLQPGRTGV